MPYRVDDLSQAIHLYGVIESNKLIHQVESLRQDIMSSGVKLTCAGDYFNIWSLRLLISCDICTVSTVFHMHITGRY